MTADYAIGCLQAYEHLGMQKTAHYKNTLIKHAELNTGTIFGLLLGAGLGLHLMAKKDKERTARPYQLEGNPLLYPQPELGPYAHPHR